MNAKLYLVPTPIGNLEDITLRAIRILKEVSLILAEDTRQSAKLLKHYEISTPMQSHHQHNEHKTTSFIVSRLQAGESIALITDAGTPGISDPGFFLVRECVKQGVEVECLPGATAFVPALVNSGIPCDTFFFEGFLPIKKGRQTRIQELSLFAHTIVLYESPYRLVKTIEQLIPLFGADRRGAVSRELSKLYEENKRGTLLELAEYFKQKEVKGEIVFIIEGKK